MNALIGQWLFSIGTAVPALIIALIVERNRIRANTFTRPYTFGMLLSINAIINGLIASLFEFVMLLSDPGSLSLPVCIFGIGLIVAGVFGVRRARPGLIASVLLTFNPVWYIAGTVYIVRVWKELRHKGTTVEADGRVKRRLYRNMY